MPAARAARASRPSSRVPRHFPWYSSTTVRAASATVGSSSSRTYRPTPIPGPGRPSGSRSSATQAKWSHASTSVRCRSCSPVSSATGARNRRYRDSSERRESPSTSRGLSAGAIGRIRTGVPSRSVVSTFSNRSGPPAGWGRSVTAPPSGAEQAGLLRLELRVADHALAPERLELRQLVRHGGRAAGRLDHRPEPGLFVLLAGVVDDLLDPLGVADVVEAGLAGLPRRLQGQVAGPDQPFEHGLPELHV